MKLLFKKYREANKGEFSWGWILIDTDEQEKQIAESTLLQSKRDNEMSVKLLIDKAKSIKIRKIDKEIDKPEDGFFYLNILEDDNWNISEGDKELAKGLTKLQTKEGIDKLLNALGKASNEYLNPEDDPANQSKNDDHTKPVLGIAGS